MSATRQGILDAAARAADRLAFVKPLGRHWEDAPYLVGTILIAEELEKRSPGMGRRFLQRATTVVGGGNVGITSGDEAGYAQAALDLYRLEPDDERKAAVLAATAGPIEFARRALRATPAMDPPIDPWWVDGGYGTRFWVDDLFTLPPWLAMRGSHRDGLPGDSQARDLAYEWIESYLDDHRPGDTDLRATQVPTMYAGSQPLLWDPQLELFRHDLGPGQRSFWGRGNGWAAWGLARSAGYLDKPYAGGRYSSVKGRTGIREILARQAGSLAMRRAPDGGWPSDLVDPRACPAGESSATGLVTYMFARGLNEGWLDRQVYLPVTLHAFALLLQRLDEDGDISGIQPPGTGPDCGVTTSDDPGANVSSGVGAFLLAASEIAKFSDEDLAILESAASASGGSPALGRTWLVALPAGCLETTILLKNPGVVSGHAFLESDAGATAEPTVLDVPPGGAALARITPPPWRGRLSSSPSGRTRISPCGLRLRAGRLGGKNRAAGAGPTS